MLARDPLRILLVGGSGRVGRMVRHHWRIALPPGVEFIEQHRNSNQEAGFFWSLQEPLDDRLHALQIDAIICLAGVTPGIGADLSLNRQLAEVVLEAAHRSSIKRVLLASSSAVYGAGDGTPFLESDATAPVNAYGTAKVAMEQACARWREAGLEVCCMRIGNVAGADALLLNVANASANSALVIDRFVDGRGPIRSYIGAGTMAEVLVDLALSPLPLPLAINIAAPSPVYMEDLADAAHHPFTFCTAPKTAYQRITLDCSCLETLHKFTSGASNAIQMVRQWKETLQ